MLVTKARKHKLKVEEIDSENEQDNSCKIRNNLDEEGSMRVEGIYIPPPPRAACTVQTTRQRLIITSISSSFFKSYADNLILGPFHKGFNVIVGPNRSDTSNVIDAMLFVFGYRDTKIPSNKVSVLIYNSENYQHIPSCSVTVNFAVIVDKGINDYEKIPGSEFAVSRTAHKDNSSYYTLNGSRVQFNKVTKLLRKHGIDLDHSRFLTLQSEVEQISMMKCMAENEDETGMLEYLDDIIGTTRFKFPLAKLDKLLEILSRQRAEKLNRVKFIETKVKQFLKLKRMKEVVEFLKLGNKVVFDKNIVYQWHIYGTQDKLQTVEENNASVAITRHELATQLDAISKEKTTKDTIYIQTSKKHETLVKRRDSIKEAFNAANKKDMQIQEDMVQINKSRKQKKEELAKEQKKLTGLQRILEQNQETILECVKKKKDMLDEQRMLTTELDAIRETFSIQTQKLQEQKNALAARIVALNIDPLKSALSIAESDLKDYINVDEQEKEKLNKFQLNYDANQQTIAQKTLAGQLIETSGTMSGSGKTVLHGRMGQSVVVSTTDPKDVEHMENEFEKKEENVRQLRQQQSAFMKQVNTLQPELVKMKANLSKYSIELQNVKEESSILRNLQEQQCKSAIVDPKIVKQRTKNINDGVFAQVQKLQAEIGVFDTKIRKTTSDKTKYIEKKLQEVISTITKYESEIRRLTICIKTAKRNAQKSTNAIWRFEQEIKEEETKLINMKKQKDEIVVDSKQLLQTIEDLTEQISDVGTECAKIKEKVTALTKQEDQVKSDKIEIDKKMRTHLKLEEILGNPTESLKTFTKEELQQKDVDHLQRDISFNEEQLKTAKPNLNAITEYRMKQDIYIQHSDELEEVTSRKNQVKQSIDFVRTQRRQEFTIGFNIIKAKVKEIYKMISLRGDAEFELVDPFDPFTKGVQFNVRPHMRMWNNFLNLSGGEKTISSLALVFALHHYKPSPLYVMDEIDATFDFRNATIVGNYIKERTKNAQFIIISLQPQVCELANRLTVIYFNGTESTTIDPTQFSNRTQTQNGTSDNQDNKNTVVQNLNVRPQPNNDQNEDTKMLEDEVANLNENED